jgi:hypothetical protein
MVQLRKARTTSTDGPGGPTRSDRLVQFSALSEVTYVSRVRIERLGGPQRLAYLPAETEPVAFGVHSEVAEHYGVDPDRYPPHATTLDYIVAAAGG